MSNAVIITGAGSGLGCALAVALSKQGQPIVLVGRRRKRLEQTQKACVNAGLSRQLCHIIAIDITKPDAADKVITETIQHFGSIGSLINNAAIAHFTPIEQGELQCWDKLMHTNVLAPAMLIKLAAPALRQTNGTVINIGSIGGIIALPDRSLYGASKAALAHMTRSLARELAPIRVNAIIPGAIDTEMYENLGLDNEAVSKLKEEMIRTTPLGRMGTVYDIVPWVELLMSKSSSWVTGSLIVIDGGRSC